MLRPELFNTLPGYSRPVFLADLWAGISVAMVALPLSIAIAIASGADPAHGLITAVVAGFLTSLFGGSRVQIGGPTGAFIVVVFAVIAEHGYAGLVTATFMAGLILLVAGYFRAGNLIRMIPEAVISGFTIGIAVVIASSQLKDAFGLNIDQEPADFLEKLPVLWAGRDGFNPAALALAAATVAMIVALRRIAPRWPGLILAMLLASVAAQFLPGGIETISSRYGELPSRLPLPGLPDLSLAKLRELLPSALLIAFLAGIESLLSAMVADQMNGGRHRPNAELLAQGVANLGSSLFGGMPATGAIARTATNIRAGGQTPVAGLIHALAILAAMMFLSQLAGYLAMPALAALLMVTAWNMSEPHKWRSYADWRRSDILLLLLTLALTVLVDLTVAVSTGVAIGLALRLRRRKIPPSDWTTPDR